MNSRIEMLSVGGASDVRLDLIIMLDPIYMLQATMFFERQTNFKVMEIEIDDRDHLRKEQRRARELQVGKGRGGKRQ
jgi:hypothetical protein